MFDHKIVFTGPTGSGKTTAICTYSDIEPVMTEVKATDDTKNIKDQTTVAMDYGSVTLDEETKVHLYGTPGQTRFDFMWEILGKGSKGIVILLDHTRPNALQELKFYLDSFKAHINSVPVVVGVNKFDAQPNNGLTIDDYSKAITDAGYPADIEVIPVDVRVEEDVRLLIMTLLFAMPRA